MRISNRDFRPKRPAKSRNLGRPCTISVGQPQPSLAVLPQECVGQTCIFRANLTPFLSLQHYPACDPADTATWPDDFVIPGGFAVKVAELPQMQAVVRRARGAG